LQHDLSIAVVAGLFKIIGGNVPKSTATKIKHIQAMQELTAIMAGQRVTPPTVDAPTTRVVAPSQRVATAPSSMATTSNNITTPIAIRQMPLIHQGQTCNNIPFHISYLTMTTMMTM
jgi:hypothetical protein